MRMVVSKGPKVFREIGLNVSVCGMGHIGLLKEGRPLDVESRKREIGRCLLGIIPSVKVGDLLVQHSGVPILVHGEMDVW